jgi:hypothetical protein
MLTTSGEENGAGSTVYRLLNECWQDDVDWRRRMPTARVIQTRVRVTSFRKAGDDDQC